MIAQVRPTKPMEPTSPLARARRMVAETLLDEPNRPSREEVRKKWLVVGGAIALATVGVLIYWWFR